MERIKDKIIRSLRVSELKNWVRLDRYGNLQDKPTKSDLEVAIFEFEKRDMKKHSRYLKLKYGV